MSHVEKDPDKELTVKIVTPGEDKSLRELREKVIDLSGQVRRLTDLLEKLQLQQYVRALLSNRHIIWIGLLSGLFNGLGAVVGATLGVAILLFILSRLEVVPYIGRFVAEIVKIVQQQKP